MPDIFAISKGITGGVLPLGVTSCSESVVSAFNSNQLEKTFFHGHSYTANPLSCAAANASYSLLTSEHCQQQIKKIESLHLDFRKRIESNPRVLDIRCLGTILAIELHTQEGSSYFNKVRTKIYPYFLQKNILLRPLGNVIYLVPPYVIQEHELNYIYGCIEVFLKEV
jgi:adenosylmethionine-8-amino-7-oxononanoate aminotransferase